jgi:hypothetical protein
MHPVASTHRFVKTVGTKMVCCDSARDFGVMSWEQSREA